MEKISTWDYAAAITNEFYWLLLQCEYLFLSHLKLWL